MKFLSSAVAILAFTASRSVSADEEHGHHTCACEAEEFDFTIDCTGQEQLLLDSLTALLDNGCDQTYDEDLCLRDFLIIQSHHDFCLHNEIPETIEQSFHDFEDTMGEQECEIGRKRDEDLDDCPEANCGADGNDAYAALLTNGCDTDCSTAVCQLNFQILLSEHDNCEDGTLDQSAEEGLHEYEEVCEDYACNSLDAAAVVQQLVCEDDHSDEEGGGGGAGSPNRVSADRYIRRMLGENKSSGLGWLLA